MSLHAGVREGAGNIHGFLRIHMRGILSSSNRTRDQKGVIPVEIAAM